MRNCLRCEKEMMEALDMKVEGATYGIKITEQGLLKGDLGKVKCAVCPDCGYIEPYIEDTTKLKKMAK